SKGPKMADEKATRRGVAPPQVRRPGRVVTEGDVAEYGQTFHRHAATQQIRAELLRESGDRHLHPGGGPEEDDGHSAVDSCSEILAPTTLTEREPKLMNHDIDTVAIEPCPAQEPQADE